MWGAIIGDLAGSIYEFEQIKKVSNVKVDNLILDNSFFSDDTILMIAVLDAVLNNQNYEYYLKKYAKKYESYKPNFNPYFKTTFSPGFTKWVNGNIKGKSIGNGAMMRISPIGYLFDDENEIIKNVESATTPSHDTKEATTCATTIAMIIYLARKGMKKDEIISKLNINCAYSPFKKFNYNCYSTIDNCLYALFTSNSYSESITKIISYGGDTDTNACIVGSMAEALYGIDTELIKQAKQKIPGEFTKILNKGYSKIKKYK